jgi:hypothetical protein
MYFLYAQLEKTGTFVRMCTVYLSMHSDLNLFRL